MLILILSSMFKRLCEVVYHVFPMYSLEVFPLFECLNMHVKVNILKSLECWEAEIESTLWLI